MAARKKRKYKHYSFGEEKFAPHVKAIGQLALAWNDLHEKLAMLFVTAMGITPISRFRSVWNSAKFDRPKREMLLAAVMETSDEEKVRFPKVVDDIKWICDKANELEDARNNIIHSPLTLTPLTTLDALLGLPGIRGVVPDMGMSNFRALKLAQKTHTQDRTPKLLEEFRWCRDCALMLRDFTYEIDMALCRPLRPWPDRPSWPNQQRRKKRSIHRPRHSAK